MADVSRRDFLRHASIGAAAAGVLATTGGALFSAVEAGASPLHVPQGGVMTPLGQVPASDATDVFAHVSDVPSGQITVFHGTQAYTITNPDLARALARVTQ